MGKTKKAKKRFSLKKVLAFGIPSLVIAVALIIANVFALRYENLITVYFSGSDYSVTKEEKALCEEIVAEGAVLLKNEDGALPLAPNERKVALIGQNSVDFVYGGSGSGSVDTSAAPNMKKAFKDAGFKVNDTVWNFYTTGAGKNYRKTTPSETGAGAFAVNEVPASKYTDAFKSSLDNDDVGIVVIGRSGGESADLPLAPLPTGYKYLQADNNELDALELACSKFEKVILIVNANNAMELGFLEDERFANVKAALWVGGVGQEGLRAVPKILTGEVNPSGRLADTYAYDSASAPSAKNMGNYSITNGVQNGNKYIVFQEGIYVGYRYYETRYEDVVTERPNAGDFDYASEVQFPFGYGMSYTTFEWSDYLLTPTADGKAFDVSLTVKNTGARAGKDVVQIYVKAPYIPGGVEKSSVVLAGFKKTGVIAPNGAEAVTIRISKTDIASYDYKVNKTYILDAGDYYFAAGRDAHDALNSILVKTGVAADKLTAPGNADMVGVYNQPQLDAQTCSTGVTGAKITNRLDDVDVNYYEQCSYVSRNDWNGTLPTAPFKNGTWTAVDRMAADLKFYRADEVVNAPGAKMPKFDSTSTSYVMKDMVGVPLEDSKWDDIVNQLSWRQVTRLVRLGGYSTIQIDKIELPMTQDKDGPSGISGTLVGGVSCMAWPVETVIASTWNVELTEKMGKLIGEDSIAAGVAGWYAPGANIHRSPYSGRNFEYFSEDGLLSGKIGAAEMRGVRSRGVIAYVKHYALNDQETNRYGGAIFANEQSVREISLKGFEKIVTEGGATAAMAAMNRVGTRWVGAHKGMMTDILRGEWGFKGMVITDQASVKAMSYQDMISGLWAGTDIWLNTDSDLWSLSDWAGNATVMNNVHNAAKNILYSVCNSNAVRVYGEDGVGGTKEYDGSMPTWKALLVTGDVLVWTACAVGIVLPLVFFLLGKKKKRAAELAGDSGDASIVGAPRDSDETESSEAVNAEGVDSETENAESIESDDA